MSTFHLNFVPIKRRPRFCVVQGHVHSYVDEKTENDQTMVGWAYRGPKLTGKVAVTIRVQRHLPFSIPKKIESQPDTMKPDVDNIAKAILDGLTGIAYGDDSQVTELHIIKDDRTRVKGDCVTVRVEEA